MVDESVRAAKTAAILDAVQRIRETLPATAQEFLDDRSMREIVTLNLFVAIQAAIDLAIHWVADEGWAVPATYGEVFRALADHGVIDRGLAERLFKAAGLRNLIAHQYGDIDFALVYASASAELDDFVTFCGSLNR